MKTKRVKAIKAVYETAPKYITAREFDKFTTSREAFEWFKKLKYETQEVFLSVHLDSKNRVICVDIVSTGCLNASIVHPREVFKSMLLSSAAAAIFLHNHPSGDTEPSKEDIALTTRLVDCSKLLGIRILDHVIVGEDRYMSFADRGLM